MRILLDTNILIWWITNDRKLARDAGELIADAGNQVFVSAISLWEIATKSSLGGLAIDMDDLGRNISTNRFRELAFNSAHAIKVATLPAIHGDPFDRALVAQSLVEPMRLLSSDRILEKYSETVMVL